ncbi:MAG: hypothetical protein L0Y79_00620 [Chlorobi bacterium]|nr:hypothetical protein [Chlorobiota bacterium]
MTGFIDTLKPPSHSPVQSVNKDFRNYIFNLDYYGTGTNSGADWGITRNLDSIKYSLHFNGLQIYGGNQGGAFDDPLSSYAGNVNTLMSNIDTSGLMGFYGRQKIEKLCYGQRIVYEAEGGNDGFSYHRRIDTPISDSGRTVVHACPNCPPSSPHSAGMFCDSIYENLQHSDIIEPGYGLTADLGTWFIKPMMRIKRSDFSASDTRPVVAVIVKNFRGSTIDSSVIRVRNFADAITLDYDGSYKDKFFQTDLNISARLDVGKLNFGRTYTGIDSCRIDFKIYWFGQVEVWFDKMTVDDGVADNLFNNNEKTRLLYENMVTDEVNEFFSNNTHPSLYAFFADEITHSNIECVQRVQELIKQASSSAKLMCATSNYLNQLGYRDNSIGQRIFLQKIQPEHFSNDIHELGFKKIGNLWLSPLPDSSFKYLDPAIPSFWFVSKKEYNRWLQNEILGDKVSIPTAKPQGSFVYQVNLARSQTDEYSPRTQMVIQPQLHSWLFETTGDILYDDGIREPTDEEIQAQAMISISHGADGLCWYIYQSTIPASGSSSFVYGLLNPVPPYPAMPRSVNMYGQNKWKYIGDMNKKIIRWKPTLDAVEWISGWSVHSEGANHRYISDIKSIKMNNTLDPVQQRFWELGFFEPILQSSPAKYFIMVNRRCIPEIPPNSGNGDLRRLKIKFNGSQLTGFENWAVEDVYTGQTVVTFPRNSTAYHNFGVFKPGEGRLYKLSPL